MSKAASTVKEVLQNYHGKITLAELASRTPQLKPSEVSMALCYLMKMRHLTRELTDNRTPKSRKQVWLYTYYPVRLPKETA